MKKKLKRRTRRSAVEWSCLIDNWQQSGMTASAFAAHHDVGRASLYTWSAKLKSMGSEPQQFVAVDIVAEDHRQPTDDSRIELVAHGGRVIRVSGRIDTEVLARVLEVAEQC